MKYILFILFLSVYHPLRAQRNYILINTEALNFPVEKTISDHFGNVYFINNQQLTKIEAKTAKQYHYSNNKLGAISCIDVTDPLRILLYYKDFNQIIFVSNTLSEIGSPILLDNIGMESTELVCASKMGGFWLYDGRNSQLFYFDKNLQRIHQSLCISSITESNSIPVSLNEIGNNVYINFPDHGILVFDLYAGYNTLIPLVNVFDFQVINEKIVYVESNILIEYNPKNQMTEAFYLPDTTGVIHADVYHNRLFIFKKNSYSIYKIEE